MKIDKNIKLREVNRRGKPAKYPWAQLKVGDSFFVEEKNKMYGMHASVSSYNKRSGKKAIKIATRIDGEGLRVWRIK